jgi:hypothetical protein
MYDVKKLSIFISYKNKLIGDIVGQNLWQFDKKKWSYINYEI